MFPSHGAQLLAHMNSLPYPLGMANTDSYFYRDSMFNLVELSLLAKFYEEFCVPSAQGKSLNKESLSQTLLKMKATEGKGQLRVAICGADPVGFFWQLDGKVIAHWVHPKHRGHGVEQGLLGS